ncbi:MAG: hypothetical protein KDB18_13455, partial [Salinibacterium sp.]|nr:hypothetical protein [Salinibacterium sp.]
MPHAEAESSPPDSPPSRPRSNAVVGAATAATRLVGLLLVIYALAGTIIGGLGALSDDLARATLATMRQDTSRPTNPAGWAQRRDQALGDRRASNQLYQDIVIEAVLRMSVDDHIQGRFWRNGRVAMALRAGLGLFALGMGIRLLIGRFPGKWTLACVLLLAALPLIEVWLLATDILPWLDALTRDFRVGHEAFVQSIGGEDWITEPPFPSRTPRIETLQALGA